MLVWGQAFICRSPDSFRIDNNPFIRIHPEWRCTPGLMLRQPASFHEPRRSSTLLKVESFRDGEATVVGHEPGRGRHRGRLGALVVELANGTRCAVGTGFSDAQREHPPSPGTVITLKYQELTDAGIPRFPCWWASDRMPLPSRYVVPRGFDPHVLVGIRPDATPISSPLLEESRPLSTTTVSTKRHFEFVRGTSNKFWEVRVQGREVHVANGRIGSTGQISFKTLESAEAATSPAEKLNREKTGKGYVEVT